MVYLAPLDRHPLALGIDQLDCRLALGRQQAGDHAAVVGRDGVGAVVALDGAVGIEDVDQKFLGRVHGHAGEFRTDLAPFTRVHVALAALLLEDRLAARGIAAGEHNGQHLVDHLLAVGVRETAARGDHPLRAPLDLAIRMRHELRPLRDRDVAE